jgi:WD40 repeat protein
MRVFRALLILISAALVSSTAFSQSLEHSIDAHQTGVRGVAFSPDGTKLASVGTDNTLSIWSVPSGKLIKTVKAERGTFSSVAFSADGEKILTGATWESYLWTSGGKLIQKLAQRKTGHSVYAVAFTPDSRYAITSGFEYDPKAVDRRETPDAFMTSHAIKFWNLETGNNEERTIRKTNAVVSLGVTPDGSALVCGGDPNVWSVESGELLQEIKPFDYRSSFGAAISRDGKLAAFGDKGSVLVWALAERQTKITLRGSSSMEFRCVAFGNNNMLVSGGTADEAMQVWSIESGKLEKTIPTNAGIINALVFSPDGTRLASAHADGSVKLWTIDTKALTVKIPQSLSGLVVSGATILDETRDGKLAPSEKTSVVVEFQNTSPYETPPVSIALTPAPNSFLASEKNTYSLSALEPNEKKKISFEAFTNAQATALRFTLTLQTSGAKPISKDEIIEFPLVKSIGTQTVSTTTIGGGSADPIDAPTLLSDVDIDIPKSTMKNPDALAIMIGVENYRLPPNALYAKRDAQIFKEYATNVFGVPSDKNHSYLLGDDDASRGEFEKLFGDDGWLAKRATPTSDVYIFFSGHALLDAKTKMPYLLPHDADANYIAQTGYHLHELYNRLAKLQVKSVTVFLDASFSGNARSASKVETPLLADARSVLIKYENPVLQNDKVIVLQAVSGSETAMAFSKERHGLFSYFLLRGLRGDADANRDKKITVEELDAYLKSQVKFKAAELSREQTPDAIGKVKSRVLVTY